MLRWFARKNQSHTRARVATTKQQPENIERSLTKFVHRGAIEEKPSTKLVRCSTFGLFCFDDLHSEIDFIFRRA